mmetsp:Transcript_64304/g.209741  ORF Transcript_64304/g.209741 Transcript_64304/m.209741 type:complete len:96 (-) Transcript_64304:9-296(-)
MPALQFVGMLGNAQVSSRAIFAFCLFLLSALQFPCLLALLIMKQTCSSFADPFALISELSLVAARFCLDARDRQLSKYIVFRICQDHGKQLTPPT